MYQQLLSELDSDTLIIAVNQRLCAHLLQEYAKLQPYPVFPKPAITALSSWLKQQYHGDKRLLEPQQVHWLWQQVIEANSPIDFILPTAQISQLANEAYTQMHHWQVPWDSLLQSSDKDHQTFFRWAQAFDQLLENHHAITAAHLPTVLKCELEKRVYLVGFQNMPPLLANLFVDATTFKIQSVSQTIQRTQLNNNLAELNCMANWAKNLLQGSEKTPRIGCVVPELYTLRKPAADLFQRAFRQEQSPMTPEAVFPFNISAGIPLLDYPMLRDAHETLTLLAESSFHVDTLQRVLGSPYLFPLADGMCEAALLDVELRERQLSTHNKSQLQLQLDDYPALKGLREALTLSPAAVQFPSEWAQFFIQQLETIGWPGSQSLSSEEYQLLGQWNNQLQELSKLDDLAGPISWHSCLSQLHYLLNSTPFQPQTEHSNAPIQILGILEAAGLPFDYLWIMGLDDAAWPPSAQTNPFIPIALQQQYQLPHHSGAHELLYCQQLQTTLISQAQQTILSYPAQDNASNKQPSALIRHFDYVDPPVKLDDMEANGFKNKNSLGSWLQTGNALENFDEDYAPPLKPAEKLRGGSSIPSNQAACPFRAFAKHRLGAQSPAHSVFGVSALTQGNLLHAVLENIWHKLQNQKKLLALTPEQQLELVETQVKHVTKQNTDIPERFSEIEQKRLVQHINNWLSFERERPPFKVKSVEESEQFIFSGHSMTVRLDRIDELADGSYIILDYKTSRLINPAKWLFNPPLDSQLPFYACFSQNTGSIAGCGYVVINRDDCEFRGYANAKQTGYIPLTAIETASKYASFSNWQDAIDSWREQLKNLLNSFIAGYAAVKPNPLARPCDHCELQALCRIEEYEAA